MVVCASYTGCLGKITKSTDIVTAKKFEQTVAHHSDVECSHVASIWSKPLREIVTAKKFAQFFGYYDFTQWFRPYGGYVATLSIGVMSYNLHFHVIPWNNVFMGLH